MRLALVLVTALSIGCSSDTDAPPASGPDAGAVDVPAAPPDPVRCENACKRQPACTPEVTTEADCLAVCTKEPDPHKYACCLQYAADCAAVKACTDKTNFVCEPKGQPWLPIPLFGECLCGDPEKPTPRLSECKASSIDSPCESGVCFKPVSSDDPAFCAVECTLDPKACPAGTKCKETPKTWYCKRP